MSHIYGIFAYPASHSLSPAMHNAAFQALRINARYKIFDVPPQDFKNFIKRIPIEHICGLSVSIPYKETILPFLDEIDPHAKAIGAVNTVKHKNGILIGYNTDEFGAIRALTDVIDLNLKKVVVLGAGGSARAILHGLKRKGAYITILNRTLAKAQNLAKEFDGLFGRLDEIKNFHPDVLINTTSCGMAPDIDSLAIDPSYFLSAPKDLVVLDVVYRPRETRFIRLAREAGLATITGEKMLLYQGVKQFELWTREKAPIKVMEKALLAKL